MISYVETLVGKTIRPELHNGSPFQTVPITPGIWFIPFVDKRVCDPMTTRAIPWRFCDEVASRRGVIASIHYLFTSYDVQTLIFCFIYSYQSKMFAVRMLRLVCK